MQRYEKYKDSGVKWIGEIPGHWEIQRIKYLFEEVSEKGHPNEPCLCSTQKYGVIPQSLYENRVVVVNKGLENLKFVRKGNFVISLRSFQGGIEMAHYQGIISAAYTILKLKEEKLNKDYVRYLFKSHDVIQLLQTCVKGIREGQNINYDILRNNFLPLPPLPEQQAIVAFLDAKTEKIDQYIAGKEKEIERLQELKQVEIANAVTHGLDPNAKMKPSGIAWIGDIPEEWEIVRLAMLFKENKTKNTDLEYSHALKFYFGTLVPKGEKGDVSDLEETYNAYTKIKIDDIAINGLNLNYDFISQRVAIAREDGIITSAYLIMTPREGVYSEYFLYLFKAMDSMKLFHGMGTGIRLTLSYSELKKQSLPLPPLHEQRAIVERIERKLERIDRLAEALRREIGELKELKKRIISDAVTGRIKIA